MIRKVGNKPSMGADSLRLTLMLRKYNASRGKGEWMKYGGSKTATFELSGVVGVDEVMREIEGHLQKVFGGE